MEERIIKIKGLDCANCARELEEELNNISSIKANVDFMQMKVRLSYSDDEALEKAKYTISHFEEVEIVDDSKETTIKIKGLDCANCALELEEELNKQDGVDAHVDFINQKVTLTCATDALLQISKYTISHFEEVEIVEDKKDTTIYIEGLDCANCARELEEELNKQDGIDAHVDFMNQKVSLSYASDSMLAKAKYIISHFEEVKIVEKKEKSIKKNEHFYDIMCLAISAILFIPAICLISFVESQIGQIFAYVLYILSYLVVGHKAIINTAKNLSKGRIFDENFLMVLASVGAIVLGFINHGDGLSEGVAVMFLYELGELLQDLAVGKSRQSIVSLMNLKSETAILLNGDEQVIVAPEELKLGDIILVKAGDKVPVDGVIISGSTSLDLKSLNGEPIPKEVNVGDEILSGSINISKVIKVKVIREYKDSAVKKILDLVENSSETKAKPEKFITKFAKYYTPTVVILALALATILPTILCAVEGAFVFSTYSTWIYNALCFLVISCPCALVISVPLAYFGGIGNAARHGILVKGSTALDDLAKATVAAFDKTGTLTKGEFEIVNASSDEALDMISAIEKFSSHPIAKAFKDAKKSYDVKNVNEIAGKGISCEIDKKEVLCGNSKLLEEKGISFDKIDSVSTIIYLAKDGKYVGYVEIDDKLKDGAKEGIEALKAQGVDYVTMLSGDSKNRAQAIAKELSLDGVEGGLLPQDKLDKAKELKQKGGLIYVGDGINDAPVMTVADCAISMGGVGSDAAIEASDIVLVRDDVQSVAKAKKISKKTRLIVFENIIGSLVVKFGIMILDLIWGVIVPGGVFPLIVSIIADVGVMLLAVLNSMRLLLKK